MQSFDGSSAKAEQATRKDRMLSRSVDLMAAVCVGAVAALCLWLWQMNGESVMLSTILTGLANCL